MFIRLGVDLDPQIINKNVAITASTIITININKVNRAGDYIHTQTHTNPNSKILSARL